mmetsp:Transcript_13766/g.37264  ORF Transcript_13766/g.37264 Transcript_13766/m.37264 type:complete len:210 (-) Transcript_13766:259-888(-)
MRPSRSISAPFSNESILMSDHTFGSRTWSTSMSSPRSISPLLSRSKSWKPASTDSIMLESEMSTFQSCRGCGSQRCRLALSRSSQSESCSCQESSSSNWRSCSCCSKSKRSSSCRTNSCSSSSGSDSASAAFGIAIDGVDFAAYEGLASKFSLYAAIASKSSLQEVNPSRFSSHGSSASDTSSDCGRRRGGDCRCAGDATECLRSASET